MTGAGDRAPRGWHVRLDLRDVLGVAGVALTLLGAATIHWGLALAVAGAGMFGLAYRLSRAEDQPAVGSRQ